MSNVIDLTFFFLRKEKKSNMDVCICFTMKKVPFEILNRP